MRIGIVGTKNNGTEKFIELFLKRWNMYTLQEFKDKEVTSFFSTKSRKKNKPDSFTCNEDTQSKAFEYIVSNAKTYSKNENILLPHNILNNFLYSCYVNIKDPNIISDEFIEKYRQKVQDNLGVYDIIFYIPITPNDQYDKHITEEDIELDNILGAFFSSYTKNDYKIFPAENCPAFIDIFGTDEIRMHLTSLYVDSKGNAYGEEDSIITSAFQENTYQ